MTGGALSHDDAVRFDALSLDAHVVLDAEGGLLRANRIAARFFGDEAATGEGQAIRDRIHPDDAEVWGAAVRAASVGGPPFRVVARVRRGETQYRLLDWRLAHGEGGEVYASVRDLTERRLVEEAAESHRILEDEAEQVADLGSWRVDLVTGKLTWSPQMYRIFGMAPGAGDLDLAEVTESRIHADDRALMRQLNRAIFEDKRAHEVQYRILRSDGEVRWVEARGRQITDAAGAVVALAGFVQDITERKVEEIASVEREMRLQAVIDNAPFGAHMYRLDADGRLVFIGYNQKAVSMLAVDHEPLLGKTIEEAFPGNIGTETPERYREVARTGTPWEVEQYAYDAAGIAGVFEVYAFSFGTDRVSVFFRDITDQKMAEVRILENEQHFRAAFEQAAVGMAETSPDGTFLRVNDRMCQIVGAPREELVGLNFREILAPEYLQDDVAHLEAMLRGEEDRYAVERRNQGRDGSERWAYLTVAPVRGPEGQVKYFLVALEDVTARKAAERALEDRERFVSSVVDTTPDLIYIYDLVEDRRIFDNFAALGLLGYSPDDLEGYTPGLSNDFLNPDDIERLDEHHSRLAEASDQEVLEVDFRLRHADGDWRWFRSRTVVFRRDETGAVTQFLGVATDTTDQMRAEQDLIASNAKLERLVHEVAEAMGRVAEARDPYTQDHEVRVTGLAHLIATEMGMSGTDLDALDMACLLHDVGKLRVPVEILTKPGKLSETEFALIKEHPRQGYEILKGIDFPWPIADIVLQHHERVDGSGYPGGLAGDDILPVARVLAVADVVEAMATNRPYRPALGIEAAMAELRDGAVKYDPVVVAACLSLYEAGRIEL